MQRRLAILAGGRARRMGGVAKGLISIDGVAIIDRLLAMAPTLAASPYLVGDHAEAYADRGVPILPDLIPDRGPPGGVLTALHGAPGWTAVVALDLPFLDAAFLLELLDAAAEVDAILPTHSGRLQPLAGWWHPRALPALTQCLANDAPGFGRIAQVLNVRRVPCPAAGPFTNLNTPEDVARVRGQ
ncbi:MAG: molybdopterin-guanine dinucleotide biosynthesis protein A [Bradymonadia bacterium]